jgi:hypothetical protein
VPAVFKKLGLKAQKQVVVVNAPESFEPELATLGDVEIVRDPAKAKDVSLSLAFVTTQKEVDTLARAIARKAQGDAIVWCVPEGKLPALQVRNQPRPGLALFGTGRLRAGQHGGDRRGLVGQTFPPRRVHQTNETPGAISSYEPSQTPAHEEMMRRAQFREPRVFVLEALAVIYSFTAFWGRALFLPEIPERAPLGVLFWPATWC